MDLLQQRFNNNIHVCMQICIAIMMIMILIGPEPLLSASDVSTLSKSSLATGS